MIPPRRLSGENCGNGVSYRVAACRKRLRVRRTTPRAQAKVQTNEQSGEINRISSTRLGSHELTPPRAAINSNARQLLPRKNELPAESPRRSVLIEAEAALGIAQEKAKGT